MLIGKVESKNRFQSPFKLGYLLCFWFQIFICLYIEGTSDIGTSTLNLFPFMLCSFTLKRNIAINVTKAHQFRERWNLFPLKYNAYPLTFPGVIFITYVDVIWVKYKTLLWLWEYCNSNNSIYTVNNYL